MQRPSIRYRPLIATVIFSLAGSGLVAAPVAANPADVLKPIASFDFRNPGNLGEDSVSRDRKSAVVGRVRRVSSPFGCAAEFDGKGRISVSPDYLLDFTRSFSATAWINGSGSQLQTLEYANRRGPNFQVVGDRIYLVTNSDAPKENRTPRHGPIKRPSAKGRPYYYSSAIWSGDADVNLGAWNDRRRTTLPVSGLEPKLQIVGDRMFFEYFGGDAHGAWHIYTGTSGLDGKNWQVRQRTFGEASYDAEQTRNIQVVGKKIYYAYPLKDKTGTWQLWTATSNIDGSSWKALQQTKKGGFIPSYRVSGDKIFYIFLSNVSDKKDVVLASANLDGSGWHELRRIHGAAWLFAQMNADKNIVYYSYSKLNSHGNANLWTGRMLKDGSSPQERQRTFGKGNATPAGIQIVGEKILYSFSKTGQPASLMNVKPGRMEETFWTASSDLNGDHWIARREIGSKKDDYLTGYKMLEVVGGKNYYDLMRLHFVKTKKYIERHIYAILAYTGSNIVSKGDAYGIGMGALGNVSGFVNAGEDYLYRGEAPEDTAGAMVERKISSGWHHIAVTYDGDLLRLYVDGKFSHDMRYGKKAAVNPFPLSIGDGFVGKIAHMKLFDRPLRQSDISTLADRHPTSCKPL